MKKSINQKRILLIAITLVIPLTLFWLVQSTKAATITVDAGVVDIDAGDGLCSLHEAIENANDNAATHPDCPAGSGADTIELAANANYDVANPFGTRALPTITDELIINGNNATIRRTAVAVFGIITNVGGNNLTLNNLTLADGRDPATGGGAIYNSGHLVVKNGTFQNNQASIAPLGGGAILIISTASGTSAQIINSTFEGNSADGNGGAISVAGSSEASLRIINSTFDNNDSGQNGGAVYISGSNLQLEIHNSDFNNNTAALSGGAVYFDTLAREGYITYSTFTGNEAETANGGAIVAEVSTVGDPFKMDNLTLTNNTADGSGGAIMLGIPSGRFHLTSSHLEGNNAGHGGGIYAGHIFTLTQVALINNTARGGGGLHVHSTLGLPAVGVVEYSEISENVAEGLGSSMGGGIHLNETGMLTLRHSTVSGNHADSRGGGIANEGILLSSSNTIVNNTAGSEAGGYWNTPTGDLTLRNTTVMANDAIAVAFDDCVNDGVFQSLGYNLYSTGALSGCTGALDPTDATVAQPADHIDLTLADNGGPTRTHAVIVNMDLHNKIPDGVNGCHAGVTLDQRGHVRAGGSGVGGDDCDIGAHEHLAQCAVPVPPDTSIALSGLDLILSWTQPAENFSTEIWRSSKPYFDPTSPGNKTPLNTLDESDIFYGLAGDPEANRYFTLRGVAGCGTISTAVDRVGEFSFAIVPGA